MGTIPPKELVKEVASSVRSSNMSEERLDEAAALLDEGLDVVRELVGGELKRVR